MSLSSIQSRLAPPPPAPRPHGSPPPPPPPPPPAAPAPAARRYPDPPTDHPEEVLSRPQIAQAWTHAITPAAWEADAREVLASLWPWWNRASRAHWTMAMWDIWITHCTPTSGPVPQWFWQATGLDAIGRDSDPYVPPDDGLPF